MAIIMGLISNIYGSSNNETYIRMAICMIIFFIIGMYLKNIILSIYHDIEAKKEKEEQEKQAELERLENEKNNINASNEQTQEKSGVDYTVGGTDEELPLGEDFTPLTVSEVINGNKQMKK
ncbi:DUF6019 family protein [Anaerobacterium chartisolvens]|nr:hypothetical protein [Anaerobacterium chartisolvens]